MFLTAAAVVGLFVVLFCASWWYLRRVVHQGQLTTRIFPNGQRATVVCGDLGADLIFREIFTEDAYFQHGLRLPRNTATAPPLVIDCGANAGFFAAACALKVDDVEVHAFEPIPILAQAAKENALWALAARTPSQHGRRTIHVHQVGLSSARGTASLMFNPVFTAGSSMYPDSITAHRPTCATSFFGRCLLFIRALFIDGSWAGVVPKSFADVSLWILAIPCLNVIYIIVVLVPMLITLLVVGAAAPVKQHYVDAQLETLSDQVDKFVPDLMSTKRRIDYLKIDVEGAEWDVLVGFRDDHWALVDQLVVEIHNVDGRLQRIQDLLRSKGLTEQVVGEKWLAMQELLDFHTVFARRERKIE